MFEQIKKDQVNQPPEDIFSTTEKPAAVAGTPPAQPVSPTPPPPIPPAPGPVQPLKSLKDLQVEPEQLTTGVKKKSKILPMIIIIGLVIILGVLGYFVYAKFFSPTVINQNQNIAGENLNQQNLNNAPVVPVNINTTPSAVNENVNKVIDSDHDGLTDEEEATLGTNPNEVDTDGDNLYDYEEVKVYQTDPLNPDTDGDGYLDGEELLHGYNPKGPGKLLQLP